MAPYLFHLFIMQQHAAFTRLAIVKIVSAGNVNGSTTDHSQSHEHGHTHDHSHEHSHSHEFMSDPGLWSERDKLVNRTDWKQVGNIKLSARPSRKLTCL